MTALKRLALVFLVLSFATVSVSAQTTRRRTRRTTHRRTTTAPRTTPVRPVTSDSFLLSDGTPVVAVLDNSISTKMARSSDKFTMTVREPSEYRNAKIYGHLTGVKRSGKLTGRSQLTLNFDRIRLPDGSSYRFAGNVESLRLANGERATVDNEGTIQDENQTKKTGTRAGIGGAAGLLIGAIAGGGKGAAIGTIIGAGAGAGSVYAQGRSDLDLRPGTEITIRSSAPAR